MEIDIYNFELVAVSLKLYIFISILTSYCQFTIYLTFYSDLYCTVKYCLGTKYFVFFFKKSNIKQFFLFFIYFIYYTNIIWY